MKVETVITSDKRTRYMLVDFQGEPVGPAMRYIKFKDNSGAARNSLRCYCQHLKLYFEFLEQEQLDYRSIRIDDMAAFVRWLQNPCKSLKITPVKPVPSPRKPTTVNTIISTVLNFYDYQMRHEEYSIQLSERLKKTIPGSRKGFKDFLYHINKDKQYSVKILKLKEPRRQPKTLDKEQMELLVSACNNVRDRFLLQLLWESGFRISEALALWLEDFEADAQKIHLQDRGELTNLAEIKTPRSPRTIDVSPDLINLFFEYVVEYHTAEVDTNHVFIKISGKNRYRPMEYEDVSSLFRRLRKKTGIYVTPHTFRHTLFDRLRKEGWGFEKIQKRGGWANVQTPMQIYSHPSDEEMREDWEKSEEMLRLNNYGEGGNED